MIFNYLARLKTDNWYQIDKASKFKYIVADRLLNIFYKKKYALYVEVIECRGRIGALELKCKTLNKKLDATYIAIAHYASSSPDADIIIGRNSIEPDNNIYTVNPILDMDDSSFMNSLRH